MAAADVAALPRSLAARRVNTRALVGLALALAGVVVLLWLYQAQQPRTVAVLRATRDVPAGTVLRADDLVPTSEALSEAVAATLAPASDREALVGRALGQPLYAGELLSRRQAVPAVQRIPDGLRVYTLPVSPETGAGGQIEPGQAVQVAVTTGASRPEEARTHTVLAQAVVYAVGHEESPSRVLGAETPAAGPGPLAWLALLVDDAQFEALAHARRTGELDVALLPPEPGGR